VSQGRAEELLQTVLTRTMKLQLRDLKQQKWTLEVDPSDTVSDFKFVVLVAV
jgi:hypothetical protein